MKPEYEQRDEEWREGPGSLTTRTFRVFSKMIEELEEIAATEGGDANDLIREGIMRVLDDRREDEDGGEGAPVPAPDPSTPPQAHATAEEPMRF